MEEPAICDTLVGVVIDEMDDPELPERLNIVSEGLGTGGMGSECVTLGRRERRRRVELRLRFGTRIRDKTGPGGF